MINFDRPDVVERIMWEFEVIMESGEKTYILNQGDALKEISYQMYIDSDFHIPESVTENTDVPFISGPSGRIYAKVAAMPMEDFLKAYQEAEEGLQSLYEITIKEQPGS